MGLSPFRLFIYIKATDDEMGRILSIKWSRRMDACYFVSLLNLSSSAEWGKFGMTLQDS